MKEIFEGLKNYREGTIIPQNRIDEVSDCPNRVDAPISALRLKDDNPIISGKICSKCYCPLATKLRVKNCDCSKWK